MLIGTSVIAQNSDNLAWRNKACAVALTYDDGLNVHLDQVVPALDSLGLKGTFYIPGNSSVLFQRMSGWKAIAANGHELGNHTLYHPCAGNRPGREWVNPDHDLSDYSVNQIVDEIRVANTLLKAVDGKDARTIAYTCGDTAAGDQSFTERIKDDFISARGVYSRFNKVENTNIWNVGAFMVSGQSGDELIELVKKAQEQKAFLVFLFHGVGGEHSINVSLEAHSQLLHYLKDHEKDIWVAPFIEITSYISDKQVSR